MTKKIKTPENSSSFDLDDHIPYRIAVVSNILQLGRDIDIKKITDLKSREIRVLLNIGTYRPISAAQIAFQTKLDTYTISRGVKFLFSKNLIVKIHLEDNKKEKLLDLTPSGKKLYGKLIKVLQTRDEQFSKVLSKKQLKEFTQTLKLLEVKAVELLANNALSKGCIESLSADQKEIIRWNNKLQ